MRYVLEKYKQISDTHTETRKRPSAAHETITVTLVLPGTRNMRAKRKRLVQRRAHLHMHSHILHNTDGQLRTANKHHDLNSVHNPTQTLAVGGTRWRPDELGHGTAVLFARIESRSGPHLRSVSSRASPQVSLLGCGEPEKHQRRKNRSTCQSPKICTCHHTPMDGNCAATNTQT
jgi:hypothetical protein